MVLPEESGGEGGEGGERSVASNPSPDFENRLEEDRKPSTVNLTKTVSLSLTLHVVSDETKI